LIPFDTSISPSLRCAETSIKNNEPFFMALQARPVDSDYWEAAARSPDGTLWHFVYDSNPAGSAQDTPRLERERCASISFRPDDSPPILCRSHEP
jgi:hypothetical protein